MVKCVDCGFLAQLIYRGSIPQGFIDVEETSRETGDLPTASSFMGFESDSLESLRAAALAPEKMSGEKTPTCFRRVFNLGQEVKERYAEIQEATKTGNFESAVKDVIQKERTCKQFVKWERGFSPKEHLALLPEPPAILAATVDPMTKSGISRKVFIVHGHDEEMKQSVARVLEKLELEPVILHEKPDQGKTIIEKFTDYSDVCYAIVLLSPDDLAYSKGDSPAETKFRARQNVILELGYFLGKLGRKNVLALHKEDKNFEMPTDYSGVLFTRYDTDGFWRFKLIQELNACGIKVDANKII